MESFPNNPSISLRLPISVTQIGAATPVYALAQGVFIGILDTVNETKTLLWPAVVRSINFSAATSSRYISTGKVESESCIIFDSETISDYFYNGSGIKFFARKGFPERTE